MHSVKMPGRKYGGCAGSPETWRVQKNTHARSWEGEFIVSTLHRRKPGLTDLKDSPVVVQGPRFQNRSVPCCFRLSLLLSSPLFSSPLLFPSPLPFSPFLSRGSMFPSLFSPTLLFSLPPLFFLSLAELELSI